MLLLDASALNVPRMHASHVGSVVLVPAIFVYLPGGHLVWATQESVSRLLLDVKTLKNPVMHVSHVGSALLLPAVLVYLPGGHFLVWAAHHSKRQSVANEEHVKNVIEQCDAE